jgi:phosphatidate cytidylyltransferase
MDNLIVALPGLFLLLVIGGMLCLPMFQWRLGQLVRSSLGLKIIMWIPLYAFFVFTASAVPYSVLASAMIIGLLAIIEWLRQSESKKVWWYGVYFLIGLLAWLATAGQLRPELWVGICLTSVMSDVIAFFMGKMGRHGLPSFINSRKTYEGVVGQLIGGIVGALLFSWLLNVPISIAVGMLVGAASAIGDILNSIAKRQLAIKDWGTSIPGHGGVMDRFSSLNMALFVVAIMITFEHLP